MPALGPPLEPTLGTASQKSSVTLNIHTYVCMHLCVYNKCNVHIATYICMNICVARGVPRIFCRGFPQVVDPRCGSVGAQPPDADKLFIFVMSPCSVF